MIDLPHLPHLCFSPAADRNKQPILDLLLAVLPPHGSALEIASGTGQHVCWFAAAMPQWSWQPSDGDSSAVPAIDAAVVQSSLPNVRPAMQLDVRRANWPDLLPPFIMPFDAIYCANLLHIAPWATCAALMQGAARHLSDGVLLTYGPYIEDGISTSAGNRSFDASLRARNPEWGIRNLAAVAAEAGRAGMQLRSRHAMPSNNLLLVWGKKRCVDKAVNGN